MIVDKKSFYLLCEGKHLNFEVFSIKTTLCAHWEYEPETLNNHCLKVTNKYCVMSVTSALYQSGIVEATVDELTQNIIQTTDTGNQFSITRRYISDVWKKYKSILRIINICKNENLGK
jgi:hypothetical protein